MNDYWNAARLAREQVDRTRDEEELTEEERENLRYSIWSIPIDPKLRPILDDVRAQHQLPESSLIRAFLQPRRWPGRLGVHKFTEPIFVTVNSYWKCDFGFTEFAKIYSRTLLEAIRDDLGIEMSVSDTFHDKTNCIIRFHDYSLRYVFPENARDLSRDEYCQLVASGLPRRDQVSDKQHPSLPNRDEFFDMFDTEPLHVSANGEPIQQYVFLDEWRILGSYVSIDLSDRGLSGLFACSRTEQQLVSTMNQALTAAFSSAAWMKEAPADIVLTLKYLYRNEIRAGFVQNS